jgi:hypothetical protein
MAPNTNIKQQCTGNTMGTQWEHQATENQNNIENKIQKLELNISL